MKHDCKICVDCKNILEMGTEIPWRRYPHCKAAPIVRIHPVCGKQIEYVPCQYRNNRRKSCPWWEPKKKSWWSRLWRK